MQRKCVGYLADFCFEIEKNVFLINTYFNANINPFTFVPVKFEQWAIFSWCLQIKTVITGRQEAVGICYESCE